MLLKLNLNILFWLQKNIFNICIVFLFCFVQMSLNFLTIFKISQPYLVVIIIFLLLRNSKNKVSPILLIFFGIIFDILTGTILGMHSFLFFLIKFFLDIFEIKFKVSKNMGDWILFSLVYFSSLLVTKFIFVLVTFKSHDIFAIIFNLVSTLLIFPIAKILVGRPPSTKPSTVMGMLFGYSPCLSTSFPNYSIKSDPIIWGILERIKNPLFSLISNGEILGSIY